MTEPTFNRPAFIPSVIYRDNGAAVAWLHEAFGFEPSLVMTDSEGNVVHAEMAHGDGVVMIGNEWTDWARSPLSAGGRNTQRIHVRIDQGIDAHCEHARKAGATIVMEPAEQFYGDRTYMAMDLEGHHWTFSQPTRQVSVAEMEAASGCKFETLR